jgi:hypothetical protein
MPTYANARRPLDGALPGALLFEVEDPARRSAALTLLRHSVLLSPPALRPYFAACALHGWRRIPPRQLAIWSGVPMNTLKRRLAAAKLTPAGVAAWNLTLHAAWLLDVAALPAGAVVSRMGLGRTGALSAVLGSRGIRYAAGRVAPGAFAAALERYVAVLRHAFNA